MSKATGLNSVAAFSKSQADQVSASNYWDESIYVLGQDPWLTNVNIQPATAGNGDFNVESIGINLIGLVYGNLWLTEMLLREAEMVYRDWRDVQHDPIAYVLEQSDKLSGVTVGFPKVNGATIVTQRFDALYPDFNYVAFVTEFRANVPAWMEWVIVFQVLAREYERSSDHADPDAAQAAVAIANFLKGCVQ